MQRPLGFEVLVELDTRHAECVGNSVAQFLIEGRLVIETSCQTETEVPFPTGNPFDGSTG